MPARMPRMPAMASCWYCNTELSETAQYCPACGHSQLDRSSSPLFGVDDPEKRARRAIELAVTAGWAVLGRLRQFGIAIPAGGHGGHSRHPGGHRRPLYVWESEFVCGWPGRPFRGGGGARARCASRYQDAAEDIRRPCRTAGGGWCLEAADPLGSPAEHRVVGAA